MFTDGSIADDVDAVLICTGYQTREPFLEKGHSLSIIPSSTKPNEKSHGLLSNLRYMFPLYKHTLSLSPDYPTNALSFIGLPIYVDNCPSDIAQSIFVAHSIKNSSILPSRQTLLRQLSADEQNLRYLGFDPYQTGHKLLPINNRTRFDFQDNLVQFVKKAGALPDDGKPFVDSWRRRPRPYLKRGWKRVEELNLQIKWLQGVKTEAEWASLMDRLDRWQEEWERGNGLVYPEENVYDSSGW